MGPGNLLIYNSESERSGILELGYNLSLALFTLLDMESQKDANVLRHWIDKWHLHPGKHLALHHQAFLRPVIHGSQAKGPGVNNSHGPKMLTFPPEGLV